MENSKVRLIRSEDGYRMEGVENWKDYRPVRNGYMIAHDLFHHRKGETGKMWEEVRAIGARLLFELKLDNHRLPPSDVCNSIGRSIEREGHPLPTLPAAEGLPADAMAWFTLGLPEDTRDMVLSLIADGYHYTKAIGRPVEAYEKVKQANWALIHQIHKGDVEVNLETGEVVKLNA